MTELQNKILEELGKTTQSGVEDLRHSEFVETEIRSVQNGLKTNFYLTLFFIITFIFKVFDQLLPSGELGIISIFFLLISWSVCLLFFYNWVTKKKRLALLRLLRCSFNQSIDFDSWLVECKNQFWGWLWKLTVANSKVLSDLERKRQNKRLFFFTNIALVLTFLTSAYLGNTIMVFATPIIMLLSALTFLDWQIHSYYFKLVNLQYYNG
ncbi:hypothetical protein [Roseivirga spongicola]|uniref:Uncharacterized protein n=1 Tax=Roseivirga spongicola TaxID=333140 RepID=A0A150XAH3_9BACT|nr:hypothetical protein [Roseivirga spongicola]KYG75713.1 hypothetical protein AWW68_07715 [Roseivirga spongicola]WPZ10723.1 hypothetical protein T7867_01255 [Roseivirga spongicola]